MMSTQLERKVENLGMIAFFLLALGLALFGGTHGWSSYPFLLVTAAGLHAYRHSYWVRFKKALSEAQKLDPQLFRPWPAYSGLPFPVSMPSKETPLVEAFVLAGRVDRFYYPCLGALFIGYALHHGLGNGQWALDGLSLYLVTHALDSLYFLRAQVTYFRAVTESPEAPFEAELPLHPYRVIEEPLAKIGVLFTMAGLLMAVTIPVINLQALSAASAIAALILFAKSLGTLTALRLDQRDLAEWVELWHLEQPGKGVL